MIFVSLRLLLSSQMTVWLIRSKVPNKDFLLRYAVLLAENDVLEQVDEPSLS